MRCSEAACGKRLTKQAHAIMWRIREARRVAADDDLLDAFAALWTAERILRGEARTVPRIPPEDRFGLRMEMVT